MNVRIIKVVFKRTTAGAVPMEEYKVFSSMYQVYKYIDSCIVLYKLKLVSQSSQEGWGILFYEASGFDYEVRMSEEILNIN
jgi:hypothetical protein